MEEKASAPMLRIPSTLMPSYNKAISTDEGKQAQKRVRVNCGVCDKIRYYSVHRGVTRIGGIISCEACRHFYQKFKRQPCILSCIQGGSCDVLEDNSRNRCRACWVGHILSRCPVPPELYQNFVSHLPKEVQEKLPPESPVLENIPESKRGCLGLEVSLSGKWVDVTVPVPSQPSVDDSGVGQSESFDGTYDGDSSTEASLGHNTDHFSGNSETGDSEPSHTNDTDAVQWWMQDGSNNQTYFNMGNMNSSNGLTSLTPMQSVDGLQPLTALTPVEYSEDQQHSNGFDGHIPIISIKQESEPHLEDGESQEARIFQSISVKQEFFPPHSEMDTEIPIYTSQYFQQHEMDTEDPLNIKFVTREHEVYNGQNGWSLQDNSIKEEVSESVPSENTLQNTKQSKTQSKHAKTATNPVFAAEVEEAPPPPAEKQRKKFDRFNGIPVEEVTKKFLPDHLAPNLDILIIGINPGLYAAHVGHHYAGPGNHFWKCMYLAELIPEPFNAFDDHRMLEYGIGFTNVVARTTRSSTDLTKKEMKEGSDILKTKIQQYRPLIAVFNGKTIYEIFSGKKHFCFGRQPEKVEGTDTHIWVMPSSSARCAQLPRAVDKVPFYSALRKFLDYLKGRIQELDEAEVVFTNVVLTNAKKVIKTEPSDEQDEESNQEMSPAPGKQSPQKRKIEQTAKSKKK